MLDDFLEHFGVKGMKWGIRKDRPSSGRKTPRQTAKTLTDTELKKRVGRLNMEKQYAKLAEADAKESMSRGEKIVNGILSDFGGRVVRGLTKAAAQSFVDYTVKQSRNAAARRRS